LSSTRTDKSKDLRAVLYWMAEAALPFRNAPAPDSEDSWALKVPGWHLVVRHRVVFVPRWQLRGANLAGNQSILCIFDTVAKNAVELLRRPRGSGWTSAGAESTLLCLCLCRCPAAAGT
jgi:hypothetical protein